MSEDIERLAQHLELSKEETIQELKDEVNSLKWIVD